MKNSLDNRVIHVAERSYRNALSVLNSRRREQRPGLRRAAPEASQQPGSMPAINGKPTLKGRPSLEGMKEWLRRLGHSDKELNGLNVIHVAGTKGKGGTCAFVNSFLRAHGERRGFPKKIGMYTSPHLKHVRERIRIDSMPISKRLFTHYFFEVWETLATPRLQEDVETVEAPRYLQLLALLSMHIFIKERVDAAIYETHNGGEYDATNVFTKPVVTGITTIGMDHVEQLGPSIENISWHKAGIFKTGVPAFSSPQVLEVAAVLSQRAVDKGATLDFIPIDPQLPLEESNLKPEAQKLNCSLALAVTNSFLKISTQQKNQTMEEKDILEGVQSFAWSGRYHHIVDGANHWFLDGAHNTLSIQQAGVWFAESIAEFDSHNIPRILIFSHTSERDGVALLKHLIASLKARGVQVNHAIFSTYEERQDSTLEIDKTLKYPDRQLAMKTQNDYAEVYRDIDPDVEISLQPTIEQALAQAREIGEREGSGMQTMVTGSLYLVGGALRLLEPEEFDEVG